MIAHNAGELVECEVFDQQVPQVSASQPRSSRADSPTFNHRRGFIAPEQLRESECIDGRVATAGTNFLQRHDGVRLSHDDDAPPLRHVRRHGGRPPVLNHDRDKVQAPLVDLALSRKAGEPVAGGLDLEAAQRSVDHTNINARLPKAEGQFRPYPRRGVIRVVDRELLKQRVPNLPVAHAGSVGALARGVA